MASITSTQSRRRGSQRPCLDRRSRHNPGKRFLRWAEGLRAPEHPVGCQACPIGPASPGPPASSPLPPTPLHHLLAEPGPVGATPASQSRPAAPGIFSVTRGPSHRQTQCTQRALPSPVTRGGSRSSRDRRHAQNCDRTGPGATAPESPADALSRTQSEPPRTGRRAAPGPPRRVLVQLGMRDNQQEAATYESSN